MVDAGTLAGYVRENAYGMALDLAFAVIWVAVVTVLFNVLQGPQWAYHLSLFGGVVAYYGFFASLEGAKNAGDE